MKVLVVSTYFDTHRGGLDIVAGRVAVELATQDLDISWLATDAVAPRFTKGVRLIPVGGWNVAERRLGFPYPVPMLIGFRTLAREISVTDVLIVHDSLYLTSAISILLANLKRKPVLVIQHIGEVPYRNPILRGMMVFANATVARWSLTNADQVVFISEFVRTFFSGLKFRRPPMLIFNGVDSTVFRPSRGAMEVARLRRDLALPPGPVALFVGRFVEKKGMKFLREAVRLGPDIVWAFAGWGDLDPSDIGAKNVRVFHDLSGPSLAALYRASDVLVLPSQGEGFPLVVQEALACGLPVVCGSELLGADPAAAPLLRTIDVTGRTVGAVAESLVQAVSEVLQEERSESRAPARIALARTRYSWTAVGRRYREILFQLVAGGRTANVP